MIQGGPSAGRGGAGAGGLSTPYKLHFSFRIFPSGVPIQACRLFNETTTNLPNGGPDPGVSFRERRAASGWRIILPEGRVLHSSLNRLPSRAS